MKLFLCGDVMTGRGIDQILPFPSKAKIHEQYMRSALDYVALAERANGPVPRGVDPAYVWGDAIPLWDAAAPDVRIANLETSVTRSDAYAPKGINYRMTPENAACLKAAGFDCCTLANNHVLDWGREGLIETLQTLDRLGIGHAGAGRNNAEASRPAILPASGAGRVLVISCAAASSGVPRDWAAGPRRAGVNMVSLSDADVDAIGARLEAVRRPGDVAVVSLHWGPNWGYAVTEEQRRFAHALIERAGVAVVHGHSSHHPLGIEVYRGRLILYGCGDFLNDYEGIGGFERYRTDLALMYFAGVDAARGELRSLELVPLQIRRFRLNRASAADAGWIASTLSRESSRYGARVELGRERLQLRWGGAAR